jgi:glycogen synthase
MRVLIVSWEYPPVIEGGLGRHVRKLSEHQYGRHNGWVHKHPQSHVHPAERAMVRGADHIITCSRYMRVHVANVFGVRPSKIRAIPNGIDPRDLGPVAADLGALRLKSAAPHELLVLLVGRLVYEKGFHLALDALAPVVRRLGGVRFVVAGTGSAERELRRRARRLGLAGHGVFLGWVGGRHAPLSLPGGRLVHRAVDLRAVWAAGTRGDGVGLPVRGRGHRRPTRGRPPGGTVGLRFPSRDAAALRAVLERALMDDATRRQLIAEAREHVLRFDWAEVARRTADIYDALSTGATAPAR